MRSGLPMLLVALVIVQADGQPRAVPGGVVFVYRDAAAVSAAVVGDFNGWSKDEGRMAKDSSGAWIRVAVMRPGPAQYKILVDGTRYITDPGNPATVDNYNRTSRNSVFVLTEGGDVLLTTATPAPVRNTGDVYPPRADRKPIFLNIIWHQHQPLYLDPAKDQLGGPWVRTHATKDYYDMAAMLREYPDIHCTVNLTSSLLVQLQQYYVARLRDFVDLRKNRVDARGFLKRWAGKTDPWIDLALKPAEKFDRRDRDLLYRNSWNAFGINPVQIEHFPEYLALRKKLDGAPAASDDLFTVAEQREIKFWFYAAHFDPDFLRGTVTLPDGSTCGLNDLLREENGRFFLRRPVTEEDCNRVVAESYKVMANVVPVHRVLRIDPRSQNGQIEVLTTPYYHPILPLIFDSDLAAVCQPNDPLPPRFSYPADADAHVAKSVRLYADLFGAPPAGMWPGEGSVAQDVLPVLAKNGILYTASDVKVLQRSTPSGRPNTTPYVFPAGDREVILVFRDTELSDRIGFTYQNYEGEDAAEDFVRSILALAPGKGEPDALITVILDGENAWEWYRKDLDGKQFLNALYRKLSRLHRDGQVITCTVPEYIGGNQARGVPAHSVSVLPRMESLWPGSWINGNYDTWIGEQEENRGWEYLLQARKDLGASGIPQPDPKAPPPKRGTKKWYGYMAWEAMYAAEGSDWFWWYGADQGAPGGDAPFDEAFRTHLRNVYVFADKAGARLVRPEFPPIITGESHGTGQGVMAQSDTDLQDVVFVCDATAVQVPAAIYIAGGRPELGGWQPNLVRMYDDGTHGDRTAGDGLWSLRVKLPANVEIQYKYTNSGTLGQWTPSEEFAGRNRSVTIRRQAEPLFVNDVFGR